MVKPNSGLIVSSAAHAAVFAYALVGLSPAPFEVGPTEAMPVELVTPEQFDALTKGSKTSKLVEPPKVAAKKTAETPPEPKPDDLPEARQDVAAPPPPPAPKPPEEKKAEAPPKPKPEPKAAETPKPPEPKPEPKTAEVPMPKPAPKPEPKQAEPPKPDKTQQAKLEELIKQSEEKKPDPKPKPEPAKAERKTDAKPQEVFDPTKIAALVDKRDPGRKAQAAPEAAERTTAGTRTGTATKLSLSERSMIDGMVRDQVGQCWNPPVGASGADGLQVRVRFTLNRDGSLSGEPVVVNNGSGAYFQSAADSATRAVRRCAPLRLPAASYDYWRDVQITFDPREMMG